MLRWNDMETLAAESAIPAEQLFQLLQVPAGLFADWRAEMPPAKGLHSKDAKRRLHARSRSSSRGRARLDAARQPPGYRHKGKRARPRRRRA